MITQVGQECVSRETVTPLSQRGRAPASPKLFVTFICQNCLIYSDKIRYKCCDCSCCVSQFVIIVNCINSKVHTANITEKLLLLLLTSAAAVINGSFFLCIESLKSTKITQFISPSGII